MLPTNVYDFKINGQRILYETSMKFIQMKSNIKSFIFYIPVLIVIVSCSHSRVYYVDQVNGNDANNGLSARKAWATLSKVNQTKFLPREKILLRGGQVFRGNIHLDTVCGTATDSVFIASYGSGRATIDGGSSEAFIADSCSFLSIRNINFTGSGRKSGNTTSGMVINGGHDIALDAAEVSGFQQSGVEVIDAQNIRITHVHAFENGSAGISTGKTYYKPFKLLSKNIYIGYCTVENNPGNPTILDNHSGSGIIVSGVDGALVEYCLAKNNGWDQPWEGNGPIGIWAFHANNVVIQHCISHSNKSNPKGWDGGGFDLDGGVTNSVLQYNLSYNNVGPGYGLYQYWGAVPWENNIVRFSISVNDGLKNDSCALHLWNGQPDKPTFKNAEIYNNLFINDFGRAVDYKSGDVPGIIYWNNIFMSAQQPVTGEHSKSTFENNLYWRFGNKSVDFDEDATGVFTNPEIKLPTPLQLKIEDPKKLKDLEFFKPLSGSPCLGKGKAVSNNGGFDFWGNPLPEDSAKLNMGVWQ